MFGQRNARRDGMLVVLIKIKLKLKTPMPESIFRHGSDSNYGKFHLS